MNGAKRRARDRERAQRLLRRLDLEEVLEFLGLEVLYYKGADAYTECPDPSHDDENPSFHVCVEDVVDRDGEDRLGAFNCWSHPGEEGLAGSNFLDLVARILFEIWGEDEDGPRFPRDADRDRAAAWLRRNFLEGEVDFEALRKTTRRRRRRDDRGSRALVFPPSRPIAEADPRFQVYLERRGISLERATELGVVGVERTGRELRGMLGETVPAVLFPIRWDGAVVNWFARSISRHCPKKAKGRYAPVKLAKAGVLWAPDELDPAEPVVLVEGIFDAERVRRLLRGGRGAFPYRNVAAVLGGRITPEQARRLKTHPVVVHLADGDDGGRTLAESVEEHLGEYTTIVVRELPPGTDPDDAPEEAVVGALRPAAPVRRRIERRIRRSRR